MSRCCILLCEKVKLNEANGNPVSLAQVKAVLNTVFSACLCPPVLCSYKNDPMSMNKLDSKLELQIFIFFFQDNLFCSSDWLYTRSS